MKTRPLRIPLLTLALIGVGFLAVYHPALHSELDLQDDHEIIRIVSDKPVHPDLAGEFGPLDSLWDTAVVRDQIYGRFRPAYFLFRFLQADLWGLNSAAWHAARLAMGLLTCFLLYFAGRAGGLGQAASLLFPAWVMLQGRAGEVWYRIGPSEPYGVLSLALVLFAVVKAAERRGHGPWDWISVAAMAVMGASKENFVPLIPVLLLLRIGLQSRFEFSDALRVTREIWRPLAVGGVFFVAELAVVFYFYQHGGYGRGVVDEAGGGSTSFSLASLLWQAGAGFAYYLPVLLAVAVMAHDLIRGRREGIRTTLAFLALGLAVAAPQFLLLRPEWLETRYLYPAAVALAGMNAVALHRLRFHRWLWVACLVICVILLVPRALSTFAAAHQFAAHTTAIGKMLDTVVREADPDRAVVLYAHPMRRFEATIAMVHLLGIRGFHAPVYVYLADEFRANLRGVGYYLRDQFPERLDTASVSEQELREFEEVASRPVGKALSLDDVGAIILMEPEDQFQEAPPPWYREDPTDVNEFYEPAFYASGFRLRLGRTGIWKALLIR
jgi:hypothetical protein